jgi:starch phosphorylase
MQIIIAGKAHPRDTDGKNMMSRIFSITHEDRYRNKIVFIPNYQISIARALVSGCDVWLNTPFPQAEASGTSGMKAAANGVLQLSTNEGWVAEVDWKERGFVFENTNASHSLYELLEKSVVPLYYERTPKGVPEKWVGYMKRTISTVCPEFSTKRTLKDYFDKLYTTALTKQH